ncbi:hypothetical protein [Kitasatospora sp. NPDC057223]|uniref:hypothetical protein n=1 Tax=Kitasatospora sp. NPDC057223 TaxID=3346055 RepID=UPI00363DC2BF
MRKFTKSGLVVAAAFTAAAGLAASPASAAPTWSTSPGGAFTAKALSPKLTDTKTGTKLTCTSSAAAGNIAVGSGLSGVAIATITSVSWASCSGPLGITFTVTPQGLPWTLNALSYNAATGTTTGTLTGVKAHISGAGCTADFYGPTSTTAATLTGTYTNSNSTLTLSGGDLHAYNVSGTCLGLINNGDAATYNAGYALAAPQAITSP